MIIRSINFNQSFINAITNTFIISDVNTDTNIVTISKFNNTLRLPVLNFASIQISKEQTNNESIRVRLL
jgi:hypothetical protein